MNRKLKRLLESNNERSPTVHTVIFPARNSRIAYEAVCIYEEMTGRELPVPIDEWVKTIEKYPVELYFPFKKQGHLKKFIKEMIISFPDEALNLNY